MNDAHLDSVLLLDDDELWLRSLGRLLRTRGLVVRPFTAPEPALEALGASVPKVCVIDFVLGRGWTGASFARRVREQLGTRTPPLVLVSATLAEIDHVDLIPFDLCLGKHLDTGKIVDEVLATAAEARRAPRSHHQLRPIPRRERKSTPDQG